MSLNSTEKIFRYDINGLRAIAVLIVLIYHVDPMWLSGGFLGVDVFLVISGFLISRNILSDINAESFSFSLFYKKRIKRLFPALGVTVLLTLIAGYFFLTPYFYEKLAESSIASLFSVSNFLFWWEDGYFNVGSNLKPLLHTWSLGLEEQFYLLWPVVLFLAVKGGKKSLITILAFIVVLSLGACQFLSDDYASAKFFLLPFRLFEFAIGVFGIWTIQLFKKSGKSLHSILTILGIGLILYSAFLFDKYTAMPGLLSLVPCIGTLLVISASQNIIAKLVLENPLMNILGKASYSIYLVHWPLIVFYNLSKVDRLSIIEKGGLITASLVGGILLWAIVERAFKNRKNVSRNFLFGILAFFVIIASGALAIKYFGGLRSEKSNPYSMTRTEMEQQRKKYWKEVDQIELGFEKGSAEKNVIVMGNSHAVDLIYALRNNGCKHNFKYLDTPAASFNFGGSAVNQKAIQKCINANKRNFNSKEWALADAIYLHDDFKAENHNELFNQIKTIRTKTKAPIYIFGPKMVFLKFADIILSQCSAFDPKTINIEAQKYLLIAKETQNNNLKTYLNDPYFKQNDVIFLDILSLYDSYELVSSKTSKLLYFDSNHFTSDGAVELGEKIKENYSEVFN